MDLNGIGLAPKSSKDMILRRSFRAKSEGKRATRNAKYQELKGPMDLVVFFNLSNHADFPQTS